MNREDFQKLAEQRLNEARILLDGECYEGAYYLVGYVVECALKACISKQTKQYDFPIKNSAKVYTHDLNDLLRLSGLEEEHRKHSKENTDFESNWSIVKDWKEETRYSLEITKDKTEALYSAITDGRDGVLSWLRNWW